MEEVRGYVIWCGRWRRTSTPRQYLASQFWAFKAPAFENDEAAVAKGTLADMAHAFHVAFEVEEELERWGWEDIVWFRPCGLVEGGYGMRRFHDAGCWYG